MYGFIYLTTNKINGKKYIGKHTTSSDDDYIGSGKLILRAIKKYGVENFNKEIVYIAENAEDLSRKEIKVILEHNAVADPNYYNLLPGGEGGNGLAQYFWDRISPDARIAFCEAVSARTKGKPKTEEHKRKLGAIRKGRPRGWKNVTRDEYSERRKAEIAAGIGVPPQGNRGNKDFRHTEETKRLQRVRATEAHEKAIAERGYYVSPEGTEIAKAKRNAGYTPERRQQYSEDTKKSRELAEQARKQAADKVAQQFLPMILDLQREGLGLTEIANQINANGFRTRRGSVWTDQTVRQMLKRRPKPVLPTRGINTEVIGKSQPARADTMTRVQVPFIGWKNIS